MMRSVLILDLEQSSCGGVDVELEPVELPGGDGGVTPPPARFRLSASEVRQRAEIVAAASERQRRYSGASFFVGELERDAAALAIELSWRHLRRWDFERVVEPLAVSLGSVPPIILLHQGDGALPHFSLRSSIRAAVAAGRVPPALLEGVISVPFWWSDGLVRLLDRIALDWTLPCVHPERSVLLLGPAPPNPLSALLEREDVVAWPELLAEASGDVELLRYATLLRRELHATATAAGASVVTHLTRDVFLYLCGPKSEGGTLFLIAHQDHQGLHLEDGVLDLAELRHILRARREDGAPCYDAVDLAVCGAGAPGNLAACFQAAGTPIVMTHGAVAFHGRVVANLLAVFQRIGRFAPLPLPRLHDEVWLDLTGMRLGGPDHSSR